jgi:type II secretory ATPase GspE/PulE/Tfp pilus assembly ATPase PilB-like protein
MEVEPFLLASAMKMVISQRLTKRICKNCKEEYEEKQSVKDKVKEFLISIIDESEIDAIVYKR